MTPLERLKETLQYLNDTELLKQKSTELYDAINAEEKTALKVEDRPSQEDEIYQYRIIAITLSMIKDIE